MYNYSMVTNTFTITKKIAKHGSQAILVVPRVLEHELRPGVLVKVTFEKLEEHHA